MADPTSNSILTADQAATLGRAGRCIGRARRITSSTGSTSTTLVPVLELDDIPIKAGRRYEIVTSTLNFDSTVAADTTTATICYTTDGSTPTIASTQMPGATIQAAQANAVSPEGRVVFADYIPTADETLSLLLTFNRSSGTGTMSILADGNSRIISLFIIDTGEDPGDTGVDL
jgi:hypothetical protein